MIRKEDSHFNEELAGSPEEGEPAFIVIGKIRRPHGIRGEVLVEVYSEFPERIDKGLEVFIGENHTAWRIDRCRTHGRGILIGFEGVVDPERAGFFRNQIIYIRTDKIPSLPEGEYYHHQIIGLQVFQESGELLGEITGVIETGANDVCIVRDEDGTEILLPMIDSVIDKVDLGNKLMIVHLLPGLLPEK